MQAPHRGVAMLRLMKQHRPEAFAALLAPRDPQLPENRYQRRNDNGSSGGQENQRSSVSACCVAFASCHALSFVCLFHVLPLGLPLSSACPLQLSLHPQFLRSLRVSLTPCLISACRPAWQRGLWLDACFYSHDGHAVRFLAQECLPSKECLDRWVTLDSPKGGPSLRASFSFRCYCDARS